jgi:RND family efflux transporter MFP subunit
MSVSRIIAFAISAICLLNCSCSGQKEENSAEVKSVKLCRVEGGGKATVSEVPGKVKASEEVGMAFKVSGSLQRVYVSEGSHVSKGQLLAEIDPRDYKVQLEAVEAEYSNIKAEAQRVIALYNDSVTTAENYDKARYGLRQITAKYDNARNQLADTKIYAPFSGTVQQKIFDAPAVVGAGMPVLTLISADRPEVVINIPASTYMQQGRITSCSTTFDFLNGEEVDLKVIAVSPKANANQLYEMRLALPDGMKKLPSPGMSAMVKLHFKGESTTDNIEIPATAILSKGNETFVWVYKDNGTVERRKVTISSLHTNGTAYISPGLIEGEQVVVAGVHSLTDNQKVKPVEAPSSTNVGGLL